MQSKTLTRQHTEFTNKTFKVQVSVQQGRKTRSRTITTHQLVDKQSKLESPTRICDSWKTGDSPTQLQRVLSCSGNMISGRKRAISASQEHSDRLRSKTELATIQQQITIRESLDESKVQQRVRLTQHNKYFDSQTSQYRTVEDETQERLNIHQTEIQRKSLGKQISSDQMILTEQCQNKDSTSRLALKKKIKLKVKVERVSLKIDVLSTTKNCQLPIHTLSPRKQTLLTSTSRFQNRNTTYQSLISPRSDRCRDSSYSRRGIQVTTSKDKRTPSKEHTQPSKPCFTKPQASAKSIKISRPYTCSINLIRPMSYRVL